MGDAALRRQGSDGAEPALGGHGLECGIDSSTAARAGWSQKKDGEASCDATLYYQLISIVELCSYCNQYID